MLIKIFKSKIHKATITDADINYEGSITIDKALMEAASIFRYEAVWIWNVNNGKHLMTYVLPGEKNTGTICLNGAAARLCHIGDVITITAFADLTREELYYFKPNVVLLNKNNKIKRIIHENGKEL